jgi:hypothetical protein
LPNEGCSPRLPEISSLITDMKKARGVDPAGF